MATSTAPHDFLPAAGRHWALPLYDPLARLSGADRARREMLAQVAVGRGQRALDVGCGTGTLLGDLARGAPEAELVGLDPDPAALARARHKLDRAGARARLERGSADALPFEDASFDHVFSSLMFHHLSDVQRPAMLREVLRVLRPGGALHLLDFAGHGHGHGLFARRVHASERLRDNAPERLLSLLREAGFVDVAQRGERHLWLGSVAWYSARRA